MATGRSIGNINIGGSVLLVTTSRRIATMVEIQLGDAGFQVETSREFPDLDGIAAVDPDLILLDAAAYSGDIADIVELIDCRTGGDVPLLLMASTDSARNRREAFASGVKDVLAPDATPDELVSKVSFHIRFRQIALALDSTAKQLVQSSLERDRLSRMVVHDLRSPLSSLVLILETVDNPQEMLELPEQSVRLARAQVRIVEEFCDQLMIAGRLETRELVPEQVEGSLQRTIDAGVSTYALQAQAREVEIAVDAEDALITLDHHLLSRMVLNLVSNAVKATGQNGTVRVSARAGGGLVIVEVADEGPGIPAELQATLFHPGRSVDDSSTVVTQGLGLAFCRIAAGAMGGRIELASSTEKGSLFRLVLPENKQTTDSDQ